MTQKSLVQIFILVLAATLFLSCAYLKTDVENGKYIPARRIEDQGPAEVPVEVPALRKVVQPVFVDGQMKAIESFSSFENDAPIDGYQSPKQRNGKEKKSLKAITRANLLATHGPKKGKFVNSITVYNYLPGALYQIYTSPVHITDIMLQPGEELTSPPAAGDTVRWVVGDTFSGSGPKRRVHVFLKPTTAGLQTNIILTTNRRTYYLEARSFNNTYQASVSWHYPHDEFKTMQKQVLQKNEEVKNVIGNIDVENINFDYKIKGNAKWKPTTVFDDGQKTYIKFPDVVRAWEIPPLFILAKPESERSAQIVNYRYKNRYYIVDRLFLGAVLKMGEKEQDKVFIYRN
jgi:type IV secretion system protein VirB9